MADLLPAVLGNVTFINNLLTTVGVLVSLVPELLQNGNSPLGLLPTPILPPFLGGSVGVPWGNRSAGATNQYEDTPTTGVVRYYDFEISRGVLAPDGYSTPMLLVNGQFPGPTLEANWGDTFHITVKNSIDGPPEGTALHWHGLLQKKTPWYDGVPSVSMCPIAPGETFTYVFQADLYGSSWYHSHYSAQYAGGLLGAMVIHGPTDNYPGNHTDYLDLGPVTVSDLYHEDYYDLVQQDVSNNPVYAELVTSVNTLIQGKGSTSCVNATANCTEGAGLAKFDFKTGKRHLLRIINVSAAAFMIVSMDSHEMTVVANDYVPVKPYTVSQVQLFVGQRTDVLITADQARGAYWLRARQPTLCSLSIQPFALAAVYYDGVNTTDVPLSLPNPEFIEPTLLHCANDPLTVTEPYYPIALDQPDTTVVINITQSVNSTGHVHYEMNGQSFMANYNYPLLNLTYNGNYSYPDNPEWNVYDFGSNDTVHVVFQNNVPFAHPMHVHGQNMYVVDEGVGAWDGSTVVRPENPQRRDVQTLQPNGYLVAQLKSDNPGVWPFHCHIAWHLSQGLYINVVQKPELVKQPEIPGVISQTCDAWWQFSGNTVVDEIDSGV